MLILSEIEYCLFDFEYLINFELKIRLFDIVHTAEILLSIRITNQAFLGSFFQFYQIKTYRLGIFNTSNLLRQISDGKLKFL